MPPGWHRRGDGAMSCGQLRRSGFLILASCHCGAIQIQIATAPSEVTDCNCSICRRYGVLWAYYSPRLVRFARTSAADTYAWGDRKIAFHRCRSCGCVTHWSAMDPLVDRMGVNARLMAPEILHGVWVRLLDGAITERYLDEQRPGLRTHVA